MNFRVGVKIDAHGKFIFLTLLLAIIIRIYFCLDGSKFYFGDVVYTWKDTYTYLDAFKNWIFHDSFQFDLNEPDSRFFRPPVYPFFLGFFYVICDNYEKLVAFTQVAIDAVSCAIFYAIILRLSASKIFAAVGALTYATYPFLIVWVPILYTEVLIVHLSLWVIYLSVGESARKKRAFFVVGVLIGLLVLTKQYMALIFIVPASILVLEKISIKAKLKFFGVLLAGMALVLSPWVARNYLVSGKPILLRGESTGIVYYGKDFEAFERFANLFDQNVTPHWSSIAHSGVINFDWRPRFLDDHGEEVSQAARLANRCGPSFMALRGVERDEIVLVACTEAVVSSFNKLKQFAHQEMQFQDLIKTRVDAVSKLFIGNMLTDDSFVKVVLYAYRFFLVTLGFAVCVIYLFRAKNRSRTPLAALFLAWCAFSLMFSVYFVHVEIRYMLIPDLIMFVLLFSMLGALHSSRYNSKLNALKSIDSCVA